MSDSTAITPIENNNAFSIEAPAPNEWFHRHIVADINQKATQRWEDELTASISSVVLGFWERRHIQKVARQLKLQLRAIGYEDQRTQVEMRRTVIADLLQQASVLRQRFRDLKAGSSEPIYDGELNDIHRDLSKLRLQLDGEQAAIRAAQIILRRHFATAQQLADLQQQLERDRGARLESQRIRETRKEQQREIALIEQMLVRVLARSGYTAEVHLKNGKRRTDHLRIERSFATTDILYFRILVGRTTLFGGWRDFVPQGKLLSELVHNVRYAEEITVATQRQVEIVMTKNNGIWIKLYRLGSTNGIPDAVRFKQVGHFVTDDMRRDYAVFIGVGPGRRLVKVALTDVPHLLFAGQTKSGKSNAVNVLISSLIAQHSPEELRLVLIDMKRLEFTHYDEVPHLALPILTDLEAARQVSGGMVELMRGRTRKMQKARCKNIDEYNALMDILGLPDEKLPRILFAIDEFQETKAPNMKRQSEEILGWVYLLLTQGRASGIHVLVATQYPTVQVIPGELRSQFGFHWCGFVNSAVESKVVLGRPEAEKLPRKPGRAIIDGVDFYSTYGVYQDSIVEIQTPYIANDEIAEAVARAKRTYGERPMLVLPQVNETPSLTIEKLIWHSLKNFGGSLSARKLRDGLGADYGVTLEQMTKMCDEIKGMEQVIFENEVYVPRVINGGGRRLKRQSDLESTSSASANDEQ